MPIIAPVAPVVIAIAVLITLASGVYLYSRDASPRARALRLLRLLLRR